MVAVFALEDDGRLGAMTGHIQHEGTSSHPVRQSGPHAHMVVFDPRTGELLVPDLGIDAVLVYTLTEAGELVRQRGRSVPVAPGAGPRHLVFSPDGDRLFVVNELDNTLVALRRAEDGFVPTSTVSTLPEGFRAHSQAAAVRVSPSGRWVLVSNRAPKATRWPWCASRKPTARSGWCTCTPPPGANRGGTDIRRRWQPGRGGQPGQRHRRRLRF